MKSIFNLVLFLSFLLLSCVSSQTNKIANKNEIRDLEPNVLITGSRESQKVQIWTNPYLITGIASENSILTDELAKKMEELGLQWFQPKISQLIFNNYGGSNLAFVHIKKKNSKAFNSKGSPILEKLRTDFPQLRFGPTYYNNQKKIQGVFDYRMEILVNRSAEMKLIDSIVKSYTGNMELFSYVGLNHLYRIKFPKNIGYEIVEIAKNISKSPSIIYAIPMYHVINEHTN